jgi:hypothetical protein
MGVSSGGVSVVLDGFKAAEHAEEGEGTGLMLGEMELAEEHEGQGAEAGRRAKGTAEEEAEAKVVAFVPSAAAYQERGVPSQAAGAQGHGEEVASAAAGAAAVLPLLYPQPSKPLPHVRTSPTVLVSDVHLEKLTKLVGCWCWC